VTGRWFSPGTRASYTNKAVRHDIAEILLKLALSTIGITIFVKYYFTGKRRKENVDCNQPITKNDFDLEGLTTI